MVSQYSATNNILKLRKLVNQICYNEFDTSNEKTYEEMLFKIKDIINNTEETTCGKKTANNKLKCYETMCSRIAMILKKI